MGFQTTDKEDHVLTANINDLGMFSGVLKVFGRYIEYETTQKENTLIIKLGKSNPYRYKDDAANEWFRTEMTTCENEHKYNPKKVVESLQEYYNQFMEDVSEDYANHQVVKEVYENIQSLHPSLEKYEVKFPEVKYSLKYVNMLIIKQ